MCNGMYGGMVEAVDLINAGCAYTVSPMVKITVPSGNDIGNGARATSGISTNGSIQFVTITRWWFWIYYKSKPILYWCRWNTLPVGVDTGYGYGVINNAGVVTAAYIRYGGENYNLTGLSSIGNIGVDDPVGLGTTVGVGTYIYNEVVVGGTSKTSARVNSWDAETELSQLRLLMELCSLMNLIIGQDSGACYAMRSQIVDDLVTPYADNDTIEEEAAKILDFTDSNPFGDP